MHDYWCTRYHCLMIYFYFMCTGILPVCISLYNSVRSLGIGVTVVSCYVGAGNFTQVLWKSSQCSSQLSHVCSLVWDFKQNNGQASVLGMCLKQSCITSCGFLHLPSMHLRQCADKRHSLCLPSSSCVSLHVFSLRPFPVRLALCPGLERLKRH